MKYPQVEFDFTVPIFMIVYSTLHLINNSYIGISSMSLSPETCTDALMY